MEVGILRKIDELGRVTLPKEYRDFYHLDTGTTICILATTEGVLVTNPKYKVIEIQEKDEF